MNSSAGLFNERGNPWLTNEEQNRDFPLNRSLIGDKPETELQKQARLIRQRTAEALGIPTKDFKGPKPRIEVNPDLDAVTKATRAVAKPKYVDPKGIETKRDQLRWRAELLRKINKAIQGDVINCRDKIVKPTKVKGSFYRFPDVKDKLPDNEYEPRPFFGRPDGKKRGR